MEKEITSKIIEERIGGRIEVLVSDEYGDEYSVEIYNDKIDIEINPTTKNEEIISFIVEAPEGAASQIFVIRIEDFSGEIGVKIDGIEITKSQP